MAPDKIYTDNRGVYAELPVFSQADANVEYIRKDALLEWAKKELEKWSSESNTAQGVKIGITLVLDKMESL